MYLDKPMTLRQPGRRNRKRGPGSSRASAVIVVAALVGVNFFLFFGSDGDIVPPTLEDRLQIAPSVVLPGSDSGAPGQAVTPDLRATPEERDDFGEPVGRKVAGELKRGQTILKALRIEGIDSRTAQPLIRSMETVFDFRNAQVGNRFEALLDDEGQIQRFTYTLSPLDIFEVYRQEDGDYEARKKAVPTRVELAHVGCTIKSSLYESMSRCGAGPQLAALLIDIFAWDVDFFQDARTGDEFRVIVEKLSVDGRFLKYGNILAAEYKGKYGHHRIVRYTNPDGHAGYFSPSGRAVKKDFLKSPLKYTRVSAQGEAGIRGNLKKAAPVVYTASAGTPVWAVGNGTVVFAGKSGSLGNTVTIRHENGYTSTYGHLAKLGRGIRVGKLVNQKTVIGRVGESGRASNPKLLFSLRRNGKLQNPLKIRFTESDPVSEGDRVHFEREVQTLLDDLEATEIVGRADKRS